VSPARSLSLAATGSAALYLIFYYVPISAGHTVEIFPWRPLGSWSIGSPGGLALFYATILGALFGLYAYGAATLRTNALQSPGARRVVYAGAVVILVILLFVPSLLSKDLFDYMVHGRILALHRANPFQVPAAAFGADEFFRAMGWPQYTALYGPGWISACALLSLVAPGSVAASVLVFKVLFAAVHLGNGVLIGALLRGYGRRSLLGEILYLWNPLVITQVVAQGHNDGFLILWALLGLLLVQRRDAVRSFYDESLGVVCLTISILVKYVTGPLLLFALAARWKERGGLRGLARAAALGGIALLVILVGYMPYMAGMDIFHFLRPYEHGAYQGGALMVLQTVLHKVIGQGGLAGEKVGDLMLATSSSLALLTAVGALILAVRIRREEDVPRYGLYVLMAYVLAATALLRISYGVWIVALAALILPGRIRTAAFILSATFMSLEIYWVYAIRMMGSGVSTHREQALATLVAVGVPISYLLAGLVTRLRTRRVAGGKG
jgi:hypothetical protein